MSEVEVAKQTENKTQEESPSTLVNNISRSGNKEEVPSTGAPQAVALSSAENEKTPEPAAIDGITNDAALDSNSNKNEKPTPVKRTPSKRMSFIERAQRESEELVKNLGGSLDIEGGRKTRSSTRGTPSRSNAVATPPPAKKTRASSGTPRRGRGRKLDTTGDGADNEPAIAENEDTNADGKHEDSSIENAENSVVDAAKSAEESAKKEENEKPETSAAKENDIEYSPDKKPRKSDAASTSKDGINKITTTNDNASTETPTMESVKDTASSKTSPVKIVSKASAPTEQKTTLAPAVHVTADDPSPIEPMEVDGKDNSAVADDESKIEEDEVEKMDEDVVLPTVESSSSNSKTTEVEVQVVPSGGGSSETNSTSIEKNISDVDAAATTPKGNSVDASVNVDSKADAEEKSAAPAAEISVTESAAATILNAPEKDIKLAPTATVTENKSETSDLCEPKLSSPQPISAASETVATPQYCN